MRQSVLKAKCPQKQPPNKGRLRLGLAGNLEPANAARITYKVSQQNGHDQISGDQ